MKTTPLCSRCHSRPPFPKHSYCRQCDPQRQTRRFITAQRNTPRPNFSFISHWIAT